MEDYLIPTGVLKKEQIDGSYDGSPANFVSSGGKVAQQGFASAEPYIYQNEITQWGKPVKFQLIHDTGYPIYSQAISVRADDLQTLSPCLKKLVPIMQQATVDYVKSPAKTNAIILELVQKYNNGWLYDQGVADYAVKTMLDLGLVGNGPDKTLGNMEPDRIQKIIDIVGPQLAKVGQAHQGRAHTGADVDQRVHRHEHRALSPPNRRTCTGRRPSGRWPVHVRRFSRPARATAGPAAARRHRRRGRPARCARPGCG